MKNIYKTRVHRVLVNLVFGAAAALVVAFIASIWLKPPLLRILVFAAAYASYIWLVIIDNMIVIETDGTTLTIRKGKKKMEYPIASTHFRARTVSSSGDTECTLYVTQQDGTEESIDCELIGITQFSRLLDDLGFDGENSVTKLNTERAE